MTADEVMDKRMSEATEAGVEVHGWILDRCDDDGEVGYSAWLYRAEGNNHVPLAASVDVYETALEAAMAVTW